MIKAQVSLKDNNYYSFSCTGHAGYGYKGNDVICAAVSVLVINTANSIEKLTECNFKSYNDGDKIRYEFNSIPDEKAKLLMDALVLGLKEIQKEYGKKYLELVIS
ncbi:MAG: ribosomal-processing cysteine protease Prp [Lachnospiraceae bacterium]|nr:ribosomal-processing cysteine protease Prp [Lachnospiraceae bacterium]